MKRGVIFSAFLLFASTALSQSSAVEVHNGAALIPSGKFSPLFGVPVKGKEFDVASFLIDRYPVTKKDFKKFLAKHPEWKKKNALILYADGSYLSDWRKDSYLKGEDQEPVVYVSWFAAQAYCESVGGRLPTVLEWEYVGAASTTQANASKDPEFVKEILFWYSNKSHARPVIGKRKPNFFGVSDLHGLVWEWTSDFSSVFVSGDNRQDGDKSSGMVCGAGSTGSNAREDYAAFMRYAMRSSLQADFSQPNVGFRCAYDEKNEKGVKP